MSPLIPKIAPSFVLSSALLELGQVGVAALRMERKRGHILDLSTYVLSVFRDSSFHKISRKETQSYVASSHDLCPILP